MIKLENIDVTRMDHPDESVEFKAQLNMVVYHRITPEVMMAAQDVAGLEAHIKESLVQRIMNEVYGDLKDDVFTLIREAQHIADPRYSMTELMIAIMRVESKLK
jgi:hypothetical protein